MRGHRGQIQAHTLSLVLLSTLLQCVAVLGILPIEAGSVGRHVFSTVEMALVLLLLRLSWRTRQWAMATQQDALTLQLAKLCVLSLLLCALGDAVNRNYLERYFQWDDVIKHGYLIESIAFFWPGYALVALANWRLSRHGIRPRVAVLGLVLACGAGALSFWHDVDPRVNTWASAAMLAYTLLHACLAVSAWWVVQTRGWSASAVVALGAWLASVADALIGQFWIYHDHYPVIEHVNFILYFASLAMIQQLPFVAANARPASNESLHT